jgi:hypothetical protein
MVIVLGGVWLVANDWSWDDNRGVIGIVIDLIVLLSVNVLPQVFS